MRKRKVLSFALGILLLILLDQGSKRIVENHYSIPENAMQITDAIHIHPCLNDQNLQSLLPIAETISVNVYFLLCIRAVLFTLLLLVGMWLCYQIHSFFFWDRQKKSYARLNVAIVCFTMAGMFCSVYLDELCFGGSLDWICYAWDGVKTIHNDHAYPVVYHVSVLDKYWYA